jgi:hypothetical protein
MNLTRNITSVKWLYVKGLLFLFAGLMAAGIIWLEQPNLKTALLLGVAVWACCRCYYFMFYVVEKYADPEYRFAGIASFLRYAIQNLKSKIQNHQDSMR